MGCYINTPTSLCSPYGEQVCQWHSSICRIPPYLDVKFKIPKLSYRIGILYVLSIKSRRNKKLIEYFSCKLRDESNEPN